MIYDLEYTEAIVLFQYFNESLRKDLNQSTNQSIFNLIFTEYNSNLLSKEKLSRTWNAATEQ